MRAAAVVVCLKVPFQLRVERILAKYGQYGREALAEAVSQFQKRMGRERTQVLLDHLSRGDLRPVCESALQTYDTSYEKHLYKDRNARKVIPIPVDSLDSQIAASKVWAAVKPLEVSANG